MKNKKRKGVTLLELVVALAVLTIASTPVLAVLISGITTSANTHKMNLASHAGRQAIESLVGRPWSGAVQAPAPAPQLGPFLNLSTFIWSEPWTVTSGGQNFFVVAVPHTTDTALGNFDVSAPGALLQVTVFVFDSPPPVSSSNIFDHTASHNALVSYTATLNVAPGGFMP